MVTKKVQAAKTAVKKFNKKIEKANAAFKAMTAAEKRVAIAKDVLKHIKSAVVLPMTGAYVQSGLEEKDFKKFVGLRTKDVQLQDIYAATKTCDVCALGAMFFCTVKVANNLTLDKIQYTPSHIDIGDEEIGSPGQSDIYRYMERYFNRDQLALIESAFECEWMEDHDRRSSANDKERTGANDKKRTMEMAVASDMFELSMSNTERMTRIMQNIIDNKGKFVVPVGESVDNDFETDET